MNLKRTLPFSWSFGLLYKVFGTTLTLLRSYRPNSAILLEFRARLRLCSLLLSPSHVIAATLSLSPLQTAYLLTISGLVGLFACGLTLLGPPAHLYSHPSLCSLHFATDTTIHTQSWAQRRRAIVRYTTISIYYRVFTILIHLYSTRKLCIHRHTVSVFVKTRTFPSWFSKESTGISKVYTWLCTAVRVKKKFKIRYDCSLWRLFFPRQAESKIKIRLYSET